jgi:DNA-binding CsgD family transcriptional regulator
LRTGSTEGWGGLPHGCKADRTLGVALGSFPESDANGPTANAPRSGAARAKHPSFGFPSRTASSPRHGLPLRGGAVPRRWAWWLRLASSPAAMGNARECCQTAIQFGDATDRADRLNELATVVSWPLLWRVRPRRSWCAGRRRAAMGKPCWQCRRNWKASVTESVPRMQRQMPSQFFRPRALRGSVLTTSARALRIITECDAKTLPEQYMSVELPLSRRERGIANLVRDVLSNRDIAAELTMSVRMVRRAHLPRLHQTRTRQQNPTRRTHQAIHRLTTVRRKWSRH